MIVIIEDTDLKWKLVYREVGLSLLLQLQVSVILSSFYIFRIMMCEQFEYLL